MVEIPGYDDDALMETLLSHFGAGSDEDLPDEVRFLASVTRLIRKRLDEAGDGCETEPSIFLLSPGGPPESDGFDVESCPTLDSGQHELGRRLWFVGPVAASAESIAVAPWTDARAFDIAGSNLSVGDRPAVLFDPRARQPEARFYSQGLGHPDAYSPVRLTSDDITAGEIFAVVDALHDQVLVRPGTQERSLTVWINAKQSVPRRDAETRVQSYLRIGLVTAFSNCRVQREREQVAGRVDLEIDEVRQGGITSHALLELKVLRSKTSGGTTVAPTTVAAAVEEGFIQAHAYGEVQGSKVRALCCFDLRATDTGSSCFDAISEEAKEKGVHLRRWYLYKSASAYRRRRQA